MDAYVTGFQSSDIKVKLATAEKFLLNLNRPTLLSNAQNDVRKKAMSGCIALVGDANPKVAQLGLDCMRLMITNHAESFQPLVNMSFDILLNKFSDNKQQIRSTATELMLCLFNLMDLSIGVDRLANQLNHKNFRIREQVLTTFGLLQDKYQTALRSSPSIVAKIVALLSDQQSSIRQLATETLIKLYQVFGNNLASLLEDCEVKPSQIKAIMDTANPHHHTLHRTTGATTASHSDDAPDSSRRLASTGLLSTAAKRHIPVSGVENNIKSTTVTTVSVGVAGSPTIDKKEKGSPSRLPPPAVPRLQISQDDILALPTTPSRLSLNSTSSAATKRHVSASRVRPSLGSTTTALLAATAAATPSSTGVPKLSLNFSAGSPQDGPTSDLKGSPAGSDSSGGGLTVAGSSSFDPAYFMGLLRDGPVCAPMRIQNDREMQREFLKVKQGLANAVNWNVRISALHHIQKLCHGNLVDFDCGPIVKQQTDAIVAQISDLRSVICKEGCRTLAMLAFSLGTHMRPLSDQWFPCLIKVVCVKIAVMSSAADRCIRVLVSMHPENRLLAQILDSAVAKNAQIRAMCLEYLSLAAALWKYDIIDKNFASIKSVLLSGLVDADAAARKAARVLFLTLQSRVQFQGVMEQFLREELDPGVQKYIQQEQASPSSEVIDLLQLSRNPSSVSDFVRDPAAYTAANSSSSSKVSDSTSSFFPLKGSSSAVTAPEEKESVLSGFESAVKPSRRLSLTTGPVRLTTAQKLVAGAPIAGISPTAAAAAVAAIAAAPTQGVLLGSSLGGTGVHAAVPTTAASALVPDTSSAAVAEYEEARDRSVRKMLSGGAASRRTTMSTFEGLPHSGNTFRHAELSTAPPETVTTLLPPPSSSSDGPAASESSLGSWLDSSVGVATGSRRASIGGTRLADGPKRIIRNVAGEAPASSTASAAVPAVVPVVSVAAPAPALALALAAVSATSIVEKKAPSTAEIGSESPSAAAPPASTVVQPSVFIFSGETLRVMAEDVEWSVRLKAFESITQRLQRAVPAGESLNAGIVESFIELGVAHMGDVHHRVAAEALQVIQLCLSSFADQARGKLGTLVTALFHRLADRRPAVKDQANSILNQIRVVFDPLVIMAALSPKITEIPDRMKTALMQFLGAIAPYCTDYFNAPQNTWAFLGRMANILGCGGSKPSVGLTVAGKRLLELVYKTTPKVVCSQISTLTYQQQSILKKLLGDSVPDIDTLVMVAGRSLEGTREATTTIAPAKVKVDIEFNGTKVDQPSSSSSCSQPESPLSAASSVEVVESAEDVFRPPPPVLRMPVSELKPPPAGVPAPAAPAELDYYDSRKKALLSPPSRIDRPEAPPLLVTTDLSAATSTLHINSSSADSADEGNRGASSPPQKITSPSPVTSPQKPTSLFTRASSTSGGVGAESRSAALFFSPEKQQPPQQQQSVAAHKTTPVAAVAAVAPVVQQPVTPPHARDTLWLLRSMQPEAPLAEKIEAAKELKILAKSAEDSYWQKNFAQIVSVLLESFTVHSVGAFSSIEQNDEEGVNESLHIVAKMLHLLVRYRGAHVKNFVDLLVSKLCVSAEIAPAPLVLLYERILADIGHYEPARMVAILTPFARDSVLPQVRLLSLHVICETIHFMTTSELLDQLPALVPSILPSINSDAVDIRKAVVFVLVEIYLTVSDALFPFLTSLQPSQRKLLTIYIEKKLATRKASVA